MCVSSSSVFNYAFLQCETLRKPALFGQCRASPRDYCKTDVYVIDHVIVTFACLKNRYAVLLNQYNL